MRLAVPASQSDLSAFAWPGPGRLSRRAGQEALAYAAGEHFCEHTDYQRIQELSNIVWRDI
jgi:hypothetical protein